MSGSGGINVITQSIDGYGMSQELPGGMTEANNITYTGDVNFTGTVSVQGVPIADANVTVGGTYRVAAIPFGAAELGGVETNTSFSFPANGALALGAWINVSDGESGTIDVGTQGTSNDPDGLLDGISVTSTGYVVPAATITTGLNGKYISATTFGALTTQIQLGTDDDGDSGYIIARPTFITGGDPVSITSSGDLNSCSGTLFIAYIDLADIS
jgi:hypothetical protein